MGLLLGAVLTTGCWKVSDWVQGVEARFDYVSGFMSHLQMGR